jgi:hypothetical protein
MPPIYNPFDWYWRKRDGSAYHSRREREVPADDPEYQAWLAEGRVPQQYPVDTYGKENRDWMLALLQPWGLQIYPMTEAEEAEENRALQADIEAGYFIRDPGDMDIPASMLDDSTIERLRAHAYQRHRHAAFVRLGGKTLPAKRR